MGERNAGGLFGFLSVFALFIVLIVVGMIVLSGIFVGLAVWLNWTIAIILWLVALVTLIGYFMLAASR